LLVLEALRRATHFERAVLADELHFRMDIALERTLRALHGHVRAVDRQLDAAGYGDGRSTDTRHISPNVTEDLAADVGALGLRGRHHTLRRRHDRDAK